MFFSPATLIGYCSQIWNQAKKVLTSTDMTLMSTGYGKNKIVSLF